MTEPIKQTKDEIEILTDEEKTLREQLEAVRNKRMLLEDARRKAAEINKPVVVTVNEYNDELGKVFFNNSHREDIILYLRTFISRQYDGRRNIMSRDDFIIMYGELNFLDKLPNVTFRFMDNSAYATGMKSEAEDVIRTRILFNLKSPHYTVSIEQKKQYKVMLANNAPGNPLHGIPGGRFNYEDNCYYIPLSEGWRLYGALTDERVKSRYRVEWDDLSLQTAIDQATKRSTVLALHTKHDTITEVEIDAMFQNGFKLRPFQEVGVEFAEAMNGRWMLGDQTGLGKTWQYLAYANRQIIKRKAEIARGERKDEWMCMICSPANLMINWLREIKRLTGFQPYVLSGSKPLAIDMAHMLKRTTPFFVINYDILSVKNEFEEMSKDAQTKLDVRKKIEQWPWVEVIMKCDFDSIAFDEAHYLKNVDSMRSQAGRKLVDIPSVMLATATPVVNRVDELWPLLHIIDPHTFTYQATFIKQYSADGKHAQNVDQLRELMKFIMIRRKKSDVQKDLPPVVDINRYHKLSVKAQGIYDKILAGIWEVMAEWNPDEAGEERKITHMLAQIIRMKQVCAIDKADMVADLATYIYDNEPEDEPNKKVLIFSYFKPVVKSIHNRLGSESVMFTGDTPADERMKIVDKFQNDPNVHYLVASLVGQEGLTLTRASSIIFADLFWTPKDHEQCIGRIYGRLNDSHPCDAYWCIADGTIEDWINQLLADKRALIGQVVDGKEIVGDESIAGELLKKMRAEMFKKKGEKNK